mgnify:CR=1 FL=1
MVMVGLRGKLVYGLQEVAPTKGKINLEYS